MGKLRVYCLKTLKKLSIYPLGNAPSAPSVMVSAALSPARVASSLTSLKKASKLKGSEANRGASRLFDNGMEKFAMSRRGTGGRVGEG